MRASWWKMPGPEGFVNDIVDDLADGRNCVVCVPTVAPLGFRDAIIGAAEERGLRAWNTVHCLENHRTPIDVLFGMYAPDSTALQLRSLENLLLLSEFRSRTLWVQCQDDSEWKEWRAFLDTYQRVISNLALADRTLFCVLISGHCALNPPDEDVCLAVRKLSGIASTVDALLFAAHLLRDSELPSLRFEIAARIVADLALWDPTVAENLSQQTFEHPESARYLVGEIGKGRGWADGNDTSIEIAWAAGKADCAGQNDNSFNRADT